MTAINWTNVTDFGQIPQLANTSTNGTFWVGMLYMLFVILLLIFLTMVELEDALIGSSFISLMLGLLLTYADLVNWTYILVFVAILCLMFLYKTWNSGKNTR